MYIYIYTYIVFSDPYFHCHVQSLMLWVLTTCCLHAAIGRETLVPSVEILARGAVRGLLVRRGRRGRSTCRSHRKGAWCAQEGTWLRSFGNSYLCRDSAIYIYIHTYHIYMYISYIYIYVYI